MPSQLFPQKLQIGLLISRTEEYGLTSIAPLSDVVGQSWNDDARDPSHGFGFLSSKASYVYDLF